MSLPPALSPCAPGRPQPGAPRPDPAGAPGQPEAGPLYAIVYVSTAARALAAADLRELQTQAQVRNRQEAVTGVLLYAQGAFMQYLEGPAAGLARVYESIRSHPWHYGVIDLLRQPIAAREFPEWSMALRVVGAQGPALQAEHDVRLVQRLAQPGGQPSTARALLSGFWAQGRSALASTLLDFSRARAQRVAGARLR